jgi:hypothetical protein
MPSNNQRNVTNLNALPELLDWFNSGTLVVQLEANVSVVRLLADSSFSPSTITFTAYRDDTNNNRVLYAGRIAVSTSIDGSTYTPRYLSGADQSSYTYTIPSGVTFIRAQIYKAGGGGDPLSQVVASVVRDGIDGSSGAGTDAVVVNLSKSSAAVFAYADGTVPDFSGIDGQVTVFEGTSNVTASASFAVAGSGLSGTINTAVDTPVVGQAKGYYRVTAMSADIGALVITITYNGVDYVRSFSVSKIRTGYEIVGTLPSTNLFQGRMVFLTTDNKLYRYTGTAWTAAVPTNDLTGQIVAAQVADAAITTAKFAASIEPVSLVSSVPGTKSTNSIFNTTDGFLYRWNGSAYVKSVPTTDLSGTVSDAQIAGLAAAKVTGTLTNSQIADLAAAKITGQLVNSQLADLAATKITGTLTNSQIADLAAAKITGTLTNSQIADLAAAKITGTISGTQIADNAISAPKISAGAVETAKLAAGAVTANEIAANAITAVKISAGAVETAKLAAGAVTANEIAANAITAVKISAGAVETAKLAAGAVTANEIAANAVTSAKIFAGAVTAGKIAADAVTATEIAANAITATELSAGAVTTAKLAAGAVTANEIAAGAITTGKLAAGAVTANEIAANTITAGQIATGAINADEIAAGAVTTSKLAAGAVTANEIAANTITAGKIAAATITATELATNSVTADKISAGAVTAAKINVTNLAAMSANTGSLSVNGTLTLGTSGKLITSGTAYDGNGIFLGEDGAGVYKFSVGGASGRLAFDGTNLTLPGGRLVSGSVAGSAIATGAITSDKISVTNLSAINADLGSITAGKIALTSGSYVVRHGAGFGVSSNLVMWYGLSSIAEGSCTKTNGVFALATDGKVYFGANEYVQGKTQLSVTGPGLLYDIQIGMPTTASVAWTAAPTGGTTPYTYSWTKLSESGDPFTTSSGSGASFSASLYGATIKYGSENWLVTVTDAASVSVSVPFQVTLAVE